MKNLLTVLALSVLPTVLYGDVAYNVSLDTSPLIGAPAGQFWLAFQISDGSGTGDGNNLAALSGFRFGTGEASGLPILIGSAYGNLSSALVMTDGSGVAYAAEAFNPGPTLTFQLYLTTNVDSGPLPDLFAFSILDHTFTPIPTTAGFPFDTLLTISIDSGNPTVNTFGGDTTRGPAGGGGPIAILAPQVTPTPEPFEAVPLAVAIATMAGGRLIVGLRSRRRCTRPGF
jgi:hypothetical protein